METLTISNLAIAAGVLLAIMAAYKTVMDFVKSLRDERKLKNAPINQINDKLQKHDEMLDRDKHRLDRLEATNERQNNEISDIRDGLHIIIRSTLEMTRHMRDNNNMQGLKKSEEEITNYLTGKKGESK